MDNGRLSVMQPGVYRMCDPACPEAWAWLWVASNPDRVRVTRADGRFRFDGVPVGVKYRVRVWHEGGGQGTAETVFREDRPARLDVVLTAPVEAPPAR